MVEKVLRWFSGIDIIPECDGQTASHDDVAYCIYRAYYVARVKTYGKWC